MEEQFTNTVNYISIIIYTIDGAIYWMKQKEQILKNNRYWENYDTIENDLSDTNDILAYLCAWDFVLRRKSRKNM